METTFIKILTEDERRQRQIDAVANWKKNVAQAEVNLRNRIKTPEFKAMLQKLQVENARKGILTPA